MLRSSRRQLAALTATGGVTVAAALVLWSTTSRWYTPAVEAVGFVAAVAFLAVGVRWSFSRLEGVYGD